MPATDLLTPLSQRFLHACRSNLWFAFLPAICLGIFWTLGERGLILSAFTIPAIWALYTALVRANEADQSVLTSTQTHDHLEAHINDILFEAKPNERMAIFCLEIDGASDLAKRLGVASFEDVRQRLHLRYASCIRRNDIVYQSGPLQWIIALMPGPQMDIEAAIQQANRLQEVADEPVFLNDDRLYLTNCIGFTVAQKPCKGAHELIAQAQSALGIAVQNGAGSIRAFTAQAPKQTMLNIAEDAQALDGEIESNLFAWFQPQVSTDTGKISGFEALARWRDKGGQWHTPATFLPILEQSGRMEHLTDIILSQSLSALRSWDERALDIASVGVNFSESDLTNPRLYEKIAWELDRNDIAPNRLSIEVLESVIAGEADDMVVRNVSQLADLGCTIDLDDFGTGHSSISTLRRLPVNRLKIDRSFVAKADLDQEQQKMVATILMMADRLELSCLAEGVETLGEQSILAQLGCRYVQGFGIGRPMSFESTLEWIESYQAKQLTPPEITRKTS